MTIVQNGDNENNDIFDGLSLTSEQSVKEKRDVDYGIWFAKVDGNEKGQQILETVKNRPAPTAMTTAKAEEQSKKYYIDERADARYVIIGIESVVSKLYRNWQRDLTKAVMYEMLYRYMVTHKVILTKKGMEALINVVKTNSPKFIDPDQLFTKKDGFLYQLKK